MLSNYVGNTLDSQDTNFRMGMKSVEKLMIAIDMLANGPTFFYGGQGWQRGESTNHKVLYSVCWYLR